MRCDVLFQAALLQWVTCGVRKHRFCFRTGRTPAGPAHHQIPRKSTPSPYGPPPAAAHRIPHAFRFTHPYGPDTGRPDAPRIPRKSTSQRRKGGRPRRPIEFRRISLYAPVRAGHRPARRTPNSPKIHLPTPYGPPPSAAHGTAEFRNIRLIRFRTCRLSRRLVPSNFRVPAPKRLRLCRLFKLWADVVIGPYGQG